MTQSVNMCAFKFKNVFLLVALLILARDVIVDLFFFFGGGGEGLKIRLYLFYQCLFIDFPIQTAL